MKMPLRREANRDPGGILTPNPQSRNLMRYTIAPRSHYYFAILPIAIGMRHGAIFLL